MRDCNILGAILSLLVESPITYYVGYRRVGRSEFIDETRTAWVSQASLGSAYPIMDQGKCDVTPFSPKPDFESIVTHELLGHGLMYHSGVKRGRREQWMALAVENVYHALQDQPFQCDKLAHVPAP